MKPDHRPSILEPREEAGAHELDLVDAEGAIPTFPPAQLDERGRLIPISDEERRARAAAARRALLALQQLPDSDPPGTDEEVMRDLDAHRPPGRKLFEGMY